jgi:hypothetical protein
MDAQDGLAGAVHDFHRETCHRIVACANAPGAGLLLAHEAALAYVRWCDMLLGSSAMASTVAQGVAQRQEPWYSLTRNLDEALKTCEIAIQEPSP